jgi:benzoyl-CoA reductase subunit B
MLQEKYATEPLRCWGEAKQLRYKYYEDFLKAGEKGIRWSGSAWSFHSVPAGLGKDVHSLTGEPYSATVAWFPHFALKCQEACDRAGVPRDLCSYLRNYWGSIILNQFITPEGTLLEWPKPDFLFTTHICCTHAKWYQRVSELEDNTPLYAVDISVGPYPELTPRKRNYVVQQLWDAIEWMEKVTRRKYDDELLIEAVYNECRALSLWAEICSLNQSVPAPLDEKTMFSLYVLNTLFPHRQETVDFYQRLREEVQERVERQIAALPTERFRCITDSQPPWAFLEVFRYLEKKYGAVSLGSLYTFALMGMWEENETGELVPAKPPQDRGVRLSNREEALQALADFILRKPVWCGAYSAHLKSELMKKIVKQWRVNAVLIHLNRGCEYFAMGQMENRLALLAENIPVLTFEGNMGDPRDFDLPRTLSRIDSFMEGLGLKRG